MLNKLITVFSIPELRRKILLTLFLLAVYRMGFWIPLPFVDQATLREHMTQLQQGGSGLGQFMQVVSLFSASDVGQLTIFGLGIMPYISASIILQLLGSVHPKLQQLQKEGETGRKKINEWTRYLTVVICLFQSFFWLRSMTSSGLGRESIVVAGFDTIYFYMVCTITMTAGTIFLMWIGEQIDAYGIGNGISLLIMAGILARMPQAGWTLLEPAIKHGVQPGTQLGVGIDRLIMLFALFFFVIVWVIAITQGQRRIPIQSAKHVRGRRVFGGQRQSLPLRVNQAGVMPIIFASSLLMFPYFVFQQLSQYFRLDRTIIEDAANPGFGDYVSVYWAELLSVLADSFSGRGFLYNLCYVGLIYFFCYFWTAITFNPKDMAENLKDYGSFIPGYRPGARTAAYLEQVMVRITYVGAAFLAVVAIIPTVIAGAMNIPFLVASFYGGTGLLIVVSVALDLVQKIDSHLVMRNYPGLLESDK